MDAQKFGTFLSEIRKERNMTQAELAAQIHVTDKAVSRWERGVGFPDINSLEPLAETLHISVLELMRSERTAESTISKEAASAVVVESMQIAKKQWLRVIKAVAVVLAVIFTLACVWTVATGMMTRGDVFLHDYTVLEGDSDVITIRVGLAGSMGYIRSYKNISKDPTHMHLQFYSAFGGLNSNLGAQNVFLIIADDGCTEIYFDTYDAPKLVLQKNAQTGR